MGSTQSRNELPDKKNFNILDYGYCRVWKRKVDSIEIMQEYTIYIESEERLKSIQNVFPLRTNHPVFVNVYYFSHSKTSNPCGQTARGTLFTERIPYRLSEFANIKYPQIVNILRVCIQGYKTLYQNFGRFCIRSTMIGFSQSFQVKIWCHTDFSEPQPENPNCNSLQQMFTSLINSVQSTCELLFYNCPRFSQFIVQSNYIYFSKDFDWLLKGLEAYINKLNLNRNSNLMNLTNCIKQPEGWEKFKAKNNYPKLLLNQSVTTLSIQANQNNDFMSRKSFPNLLIPSVNNIQPSPIESQKISQINLPGSGTNVRMLKTFQKDQERIHIQNNNNTPIDSHIKIPNLNNQHLINQQDTKFLKSSQKINYNQGNTVSPAFQGGIQNTNRFQSPTNKNSFRQPSSQYICEVLQNQKQISQRKSIQAHGDILARKSIDSSTDTRNRDKSIKSQFSLIEDLQGQANKIYHKPNISLKRH